MQGRLTGKRSALAGVACAALLMGSVPCAALTIIDRDSRAEMVAAEVPVAPAEKSALSGGETVAMLLGAVAFSAMLLWRRVD